MAISSHILTARHYATGRWVRVVVEGPTIVEVRDVYGPGDPDESDPWIAPALWDIQTNGRWGVSFSGGSLTVEQVGRIVHAQSAMGVAKICPTLITAGADALRHGVSTIAEACDSDPEIDRRILGIHLEGPWISPEDGYRGAHPREHVRDPDWDEFAELQEASGNRIVIVTLAPERPGAIDLIRKLNDSGVSVAIGHSAADADTIAQACDVGLTMSTHLGNGVPAILPRHPNTIWSQAACDNLRASLIADGRHLDDAILAAMVKLKGLERILLVSDASPLAGAPSGIYGPWEVLDDGGIVLAGTPYLAGSNLSLWDAVGNLMKAARVSLEDAIDAATHGPAELLGREAPDIEDGAEADLVLFRFDEDETETPRITASLIGGEWTFPQGLEDVDPS